MPYHGTDIDKRIFQLPGNGIRGDGYPIPPGDFPVAEPLAEVTARAGRNLGLPFTDERVRQQVGYWYEQISPRHVLDRRKLRPEQLARHEALHHPRGLVYLADARTRIVAHLRERPLWVADSWSAAALLGAGDFSDGADTCVIARGNRKLARQAHLPTRHRNVVDVQPWTLYLNGHSLLVTPPMFTLIRCLHSVWSGEHSWQVPPIGQLPAALIRSVQVVDHFRWSFGVDHHHVRQAGKELIDARRLKRIAALSAPGMASPQESLLRIIAQEAAKQHRGRFHPQVPVYTDGRVGEPGTKESGSMLLTILDLANTEWRIGLMYDGAHHWGKAQRERDARINFELMHSGWLLLRVSHSMLNDPETLMKRISEAIERRVREGWGS